MTQGERVKEVRKSLRLTMDKFGEKLGVGKTAISKIEKDERSLTDLMAKAICREYSVSYEWLTAETGVMFTDLPQTVLDELCNQYDLDSADRALIQEYLKLNAQERNVLKNYIRNVFNVAEKAESVQDRIDAEVEAYRRELELEASRAGGSSASGESADTRLA